jgi:threonine dehydratase
MTGTSAPASGPAVPVVGLADVRAARELLAGVARTTPLEGMRGLSEQVGGEVLLKCENLQRTGSFKIRGAYVRIARLSDEERARGVVAASAGNHAQGVALAASLLGCTSTVFMPEAAPLPKVAATQAYGAHVRHAGHTVDEALVAARLHAAETGAVLIHPFDHADVIAGRAPSGSRSSSSARRCARWSSAPAGAGWWPASPRRSRRCGPTCGSSRRRPPAPRRSRRRCSPGGRSP